MKVDLISRQESFLFVISPAFLFPSLITLEISRLIFFSLITVKLQLFIYLLTKDSKTIDQ